MAKKKVSIKEVKKSEWHKATGYKVIIRAIRKAPDQKYRGILYKGSEEISRTVGPDKQYILEYFLASLPPEEEPEYYIIRY